MREKKVQPSGELKEEISKPKEDAKKEVVSGMVKVEPKKDFKIVANSDVFDLKKGVETEVPGKYIQNLKTEGVI